MRVEALIADGETVPLEADRVPALPAGTQKFELRYTALSLTAPEHNSFRYRLEPFEKQWTDAGTERTAHYTNLPPGSYRFRPAGGQRGRRVERGGRDGGVHPAPAFVPDDLVPGAGGRRCRGPGLVVAAGA